MKRNDLSIQNATRIIITRANNWTQDSRLYSIEIRWDYEKTFAKYVWNNEKYSLPSPVANKVVHIDTKIVAKACAKLGLMFKSRFELNIDQDVYMEVWRKDLRDNKSEQVRLTTQEVFKGTGYSSFSLEANINEDVKSDLFEEPECDPVVEVDDALIDSFSEVVVLATTDVVIKKKEEVVVSGFTVQEPEEVSVCDEW